MRLTYETGVATLIQFIVLAFLNIANTVTSIVTTCGHSGSDCVGNMLTSIIFYLLIIAWFGFIVALGYAAQSKRSKRFSQFLIAAEGAVVLVASYNIKLSITYHNSALASFTSFIDLVLSVWVITLAFRLMRSGGGRVVARRRVRRHTKLD